MTIEIRMAKGSDFELESGFGLEPSDGTCEDAERTSGLVRVSVTVYVGFATPKNG
jgi:hypothetical protein